VGKVLPHNGYLYHKNHKQQPSTRRVFNCCTRGCEERNISHTTVSYSPQVSACAFRQVRTTLPCVMGDQPTWAPVSTKALTGTPLTSMLMYSMNTCANSCGCARRQCNHAH
jgi:hypothetical protein